MQKNKCWKMALLFRLLKWCIIIVVLVLLIQFWLVNKSYIFSEDIVAAVAKKHIGKNVKESYRSIHHDFKKNYPGHILPESDLHWIFVNAGGWMGSMCLLHASATEYILFFGTAVETVGHSGRYWANISDTVLTGEFVQWKEGTMKAIRHKPGETVPHAWGEATAVNFKADTWMVEYGRGFIPSTLGFAMADTIFSTQDFMTMFYIFRIYCKATVQEISHYLVNYKDLIS